MNNQYQDTQEVKKILFKALLALNHDLVNIHFQVGYTSGNMRMYRCKCTAEVRAYERDEDDIPEEDELDTYTEYTIIGETDDPEYPQQYSFVDDMIVDAKINVG